MKQLLKPASQGKALTGIAGLDEITGGGLPRGRATLFVGGPGSGKTVLALQTLVNGARFCNEPGIFVAFEENSRQIIANASCFGWDLPALERKKLFFLDAQTKPEMIQSGNFDLSGMLAALAAKAKAIGARRIVFDSVDVLLQLLENPAAERREIYRLHAWLLQSGLSAIITSKVFGENMRPTNQHALGFLQFMVDCAVALRHDLVDGVSQRNLCVIKYRGSAFHENESPVMIGGQGMEVAVARRLSGGLAKVTNERVSSGVPRLDVMLGGGYYRGASVLITGSPGTAKSTLAGTFAEAACRRGEPTLFISFDSASAELIRNLASVNIRLSTFQKRGLLHLVATRTGDGSAEDQFMRIKKLAGEFKVRNLVIDPVSALSKQGNELTAHSVMERLTDWVKSEGITLVSTSLLDSASPEQEGTPLQISTIADTWLHLSYVVHAGERNRALTIVKSRGTAHSNQVRELVLSGRGVSLADVYSAGGEVLMGALRWEKEKAVAAAQRQRQADASRQLNELELAEFELTARLKSLERKLAAKRAARAALKQAESQWQTRLSAQRSEMRGLRRADAK
jgi:circadian clock protein KaiC